MKIILLSGIDKTLRMLAGEYTQSYPKQENIFKAIKTTQPHLIAQIKKAAGIP